MNKYLLFGHGGSYNRGCEAIVKTTSRLLKEFFPDSKISLVSCAPQQDYFLEEIDEIVDGRPLKINRYSLSNILAYLLLRLKKGESFIIGRQHSRILKSIKKSDICLSVGGDNYCYGEQPVLYELNRRIKLLGLMNILWSASIGGEDLSESKIKDLSSFDLIIARESLTCDLLTNEGINKNVKLYPDPAFTLESELLELPEKWKDRDAVGINLSALVCKKNKFLQTSIVKLIEHIFNNTNFVVVLIPHVVQEYSNDYALLKNIYDSFIDKNRLILIDGSHNASQLKGFISRTKMFIGARTHATIAAYSSCVPTLVLGYSVKSRGISRDIFKSERLVLDIKNISDSKSIIKGFCELQNQQEDARKVLIKVVPDVIDNARKAVRELVFR